MLSSIFKYTLIREKNMTKSQLPHIRLRYLKMQNFKGFDVFEIEFPPPRMTVDPDILVMGSGNGLGKTSVLEACVLLFFAAAIGTESFKVANRYLTIDLNELLIQTGAKQTVIEGTFEVGNESINVTFSIDKQGHINIEKSHENMAFFLTSGEDDAFRLYRREIEKFWAAVAGLNFDPLLLPPLMYFHSYRKIQEGYLELGTIFEKASGDKQLPFQELLTSHFKIEILHTMMSEANMFEGVEDVTAQETLEKLNHLVEIYAKCRIAKLRPSSKSTIEFRIRPIDGGSTFTFDALSSGQKEIISTLFLLWRYSNNHPSIILIDEPELHLNLEWHRGFIRQLYKFAPHSQYIIATHSEGIFSTVAQERRVLLLEELENTESDMILDEGITKCLN